jgi:GT2 family glycosyltransferase
MREVGTPDLSVIIITWNVRELTLGCLESIRREAGSLSVEVLIVDNASSDGTVAAVREHFPEVVLIANAENVGFPRANNQALREARGRHILFLNPDTVVGPGTLERCVAELDADHAVGLVGCRLMYPNGEVQLEGGRRTYRLRHLLGEVLYLHMFFPRHRVFAHQLMGDWDHRDTRDVEAICGAFMMTRREVALELGGLPEDIFMYHEDLSFCLRILKAGYRIRYLGEVETIHYANQSSRKSRSRLELLEGECKLRLIEEAQGRSAAVVGRVVFGVRSLLRLMIAGVGSVVPGVGRARERYPRVFDGGLHLLHLAWSISPRIVRGRIPVAPAGNSVPVERGERV